MACQVKYIIPKENIAFAQTYFAVQTRKLELIQEQIHGLERLQARQKLTTSEKELSGLIYKQTQIANHISQIRTKAKQLQSEAKEVLKQAKQQVEQMILGGNYVRRK